MHKWTILAFTLGLGLSVSGCGSENACQQASDKVLSCMRTLSCDQLTDPDNKADCEAQKAAALAETGSMAGVSCSGALKARADEINRCTLDTAVLCGACTADTQDPAAAAPSNGAKLFDWNACYANGGSNWSGNQIGNACMHQWGSYPAACDKLANNTKASGKKCKNVCNKGDCNSGCFNKYMVGESIDYLASTYQCN